MIQLCIFSARKTTLLSTHNFQRWLPINLRLPRASILLLLCIPCCCHLVFLFPSTIPSLRIYCCFYVFLFPSTLLSFHIPYSLLLCIFIPLDYSVSSYFMLLCLFVPIYSSVSSYSQLLCLLVSIYSSVSAYSLLLCILFPSTLLSLHILEQPQPIEIVKIYTRPILSTLPV